MNSQPLEKKTIQRYNNALIKAGERKLVREFVSKSNGMPVKVYEHSNFEIKKISLSNYAKREAEIRAELAVNFDFLFRTNQIQKENAFQKDIVGEMDKKNLYTVDYTPSRGKYSGIETTLYYYNAELFAWLKDTASLEEGNIVKHFHLTDFWSHEDIPKADIANEGGVKFSRGKKPENLLKRIIEISTSEGDYVLDSFLGSGTTAAVAHKLKRKWIGIEMGDQCLTHCHKRLKNVVNGKDVTGITKKVEWNGGGGFQFLRLAPSLLQKDDLGNWVINNEYNALQLAEAVCQHENFKFFPHESVYWKQGYSGEKDFIFVTTQFLTSEHLDRIQDQMQKDETLLVCAKAFRVKKEKYKNITLKKIPQMLLGRCEFGRDDYSLNIREEVQEELGMDLDV